MQVLEDRRGCQSREAEESEGQEVGEEEEVEKMIECKLYFWQGRDANNPVNAFSIK